MSAARRQMIPVIDLSDALDRAVTATASISYEQKLAVDTRTVLYRFRCSTCGRLGCWLERPEVVRANGTAHAATHTEETP